MTEKEFQIIQSVANYIEAKFKGEHTGHDWWHIYRVWQLAKEIAKQENANVFIVELGALLHDVADHKLANEEEGLQEVNEILNSYLLSKEKIQHILEIVKNTSFRGANIVDNAETLEAKIVQDADRLDAIGAIGIARTFAYGGDKKREIYNPEISPELHSSFDSYKKSTAPTINHFYEKLLLLKDRMHTETARKIAEERHTFMENFLEQFYKEWDIGKKLE